MSNLIQELIQENSKEYKSDLFTLIISYFQNTEQITEKDKEMLDRMQALHQAIQELEDEKLKEIASENKKIIEAMEGDSRKIPDYKG